MDNHEWLARPENRPSAIGWSTPSPVPEVSLPTIAAKARAVADRFERSAETPASRSAATALRAFAIGVESIPGAAGRLSAWQTGFVEHLRENLGRLDPAPIDVAALPRQVRSHYASDDGDFALYIYPVQDLWDQSNLAAFVGEIDRRLETVPGAPRATGIAPNIFHTTGAVERAFYTATGLALGLIVILIAIDFRRPLPTLLALSVLALGLPMLIGLMGLLGVSWNFANFFGLPILIGAGHEYGVFLVHRALEARTDQADRGHAVVWRGWDVSDRALLLCAFATCASFGYFWAVGHHEGLRSLGLVMALGIACIYLAAVLTLRPLLRFWVSRGATSPAARGPVAPRPG
jgi:hypothetical protein